MFDRHLVIDDRKVRRCRICQHYRGAEHRCLLMGRETRGSFVCDGWMPIFKLLTDTDDTTSAFQRIAKQA